MLQARVTTNDSTKAGRPTHWYMCTIIHLSSQMLIPVFQLLLLWPERKESSKCKLTRHPKLVYALFPKALVSGPYPSRPDDES